MLCYVVLLISCFMLCYVMLMSGIYLIIHLSSKKANQCIFLNVEAFLKKKKRKFKPNTALPFSCKIRDTYLYNRISQGSQSQGCKSYEFAMRMI